MTIFSEIRTALTKGNIKKFERQFNPILVGNWAPIKAKEELEKLFDNLSNDPFFQSSPFYLSVPFSCAQDFSERGAPKGIVVGTTINFSVSEGAFQESAGVQVLKNSLSRFVVLDATDKRNATGLSLGHINTQVRKFTEGGLLVFLILGENMKEFIEGHVLEILKEQITGTLEGVPDDSLSHVTIIYAPNWIAAQGFAKLSKNIQNSFHVVRHCLEELVGTERASKIRVCLSIPFVNDNCMKFIQNCAFEGFYFPDLAVHSEGFLKTLKEIKLWDQLEKKQPLSNGGHDN